MRFDGKTALITGAAVGIGRACAIKFASEGANVAAIDIIDINEENLDSLKKEMEAMGAKILTLVCDVSCEDAVNKAVAEAKEQFGKVDILVNNAALWRERSLFIDTPIETWKKFFDINVMGVVYCTRAVLPDMLDAGYGRIINVASVTGVYGSANMAHYSATKGALIAMTKALAKEVADKGVLVNAVAPGSVSPADVPDYDFTRPSHLNHMGRTGSDMENANLICFLAGDEATYITGQSIQIDGGRKMI